MDPEDAFGWSDLDESLWDEVSEISNRPKAGRMPDSIPEDLEQEIVGKTDAEEIIKISESLCPGCVEEGDYREAITPMVVYSADGEVRLAKNTDHRGVIHDVYWEDSDTFERARYWQREENHLHTHDVTPEGEDGIACPTDCGLCAEHRSHTALGNISVTNRCGLSCFYCFFYAEEDDPIREPSIDEILDMVRNMKDQEPVGNNVIQITGGEPTIRDDIAEVVEAVGEEVDYIQLNTHSGRVACNPEIAEDLGDTGEVNLIYTSFDGPDPDVNIKNYWEMPDAISAYRENNLPTMLVPTIIGDYNDDQLGDIIRFASANEETIWGVNFQPVSLVGRMPDNQRYEQRITIPGAMAAIEEQTEGDIPMDSWYPVPVTGLVSDIIEDFTGEPQYRLSNDFACGMSNIVFRTDDEYKPIDQLVNEDVLYDVEDRMADRDLDADVGGIRGAFEKWKSNAGLAWDIFSNTDLGSEQGRLFVKEAAKLGVKSKLGDPGPQDLKGLFEQTLFLGMMHFMDPYNYDIDRVKQCDIHYAMEDGRTVPFCAYNVIPGLYRDNPGSHDSITAEELMQRDYTEPVDPEGHPELTRLNTETITGTEADEEYLREGPGILGYDVKTRRHLDEGTKEEIHEQYRQAIEEQIPVQPVLNT